MVVTWWGVRIGLVRGRIGLVRGRIRLSYLNRGDGGELVRVKIGL